MIRYLLHRPIAVCVVTVWLVVLGALSFPKLPISLLPDIPVPEITVQVSYSRASARELQRTIEQPLRNQLLQVNHLDDIASVTQDGLSVLTLRFDYGTNIQMAYLETNEKIDALLSQLPRDLERPKVIKSGASDIPVFTLNVLPKPSYREDFLALSEFTENVLKRRIEQLSDVALVDATGQSQPEVVVQVDKDKLASVGVTESQLIEVLKQANLQPGNFSVRNGAYQYNIRFSSVLQSVQDVENIKLAVGNRQSSPSVQNDPRVRYFAENVLTVQESRAEGPMRLIPLRQLAQVSLQERPFQGLYTFDGKRAIGLAIIKQSDAQLLHMRQELNQLLKEFSNEYSQLEFRLSQDQTELLDLSINNLVSNLLTGALLTFFMIFLFMRDWRLPLLIGIVIPISISVTFLGFSLLGLSINIISLAGLVLGMGEIIDSAIIILENIEEKRDTGLSVEVSCIEGAEEVIRPLFASVLTNSAVFLPLLLLSGLAGALFFDQAVSVSLALGVSLLCSYTLVPVLYSLIYRQQQTRLNRPPTLVTHWLESFYNWTFNAAFRHKGGLMLGLGCLLLGAAWMGIRIEKRGMPEVSHNELEISIDWNEPLTVVENQQRVEQMLQTLVPAPAYISAFVGHQQFLLNKQLQQTDNQVLLSLRTRNLSDYSTLSKVLSQRLVKQYPGAIIKIRPARNVFEQLFGSDEPPLRVKIYNSLGQLPIDPILANRVANSFSAKNLLTNPIGQQTQMTIRLLTDRLLMYDVVDESVIQVLKTIFNNNEITSLQSEQRTIPLVLAGKPKQVDWQNNFVYNRQKKAIPLSNLIEVTPNSDYKAIYADKEGAYIPFDFFISNKQIPLVQNQASLLLKANPSILTHWSGRYYRDQNYLIELLAIVVIAIALLFCVLTAQFESLKQPLIVLLIIASGLAGAIWTLYLFGNSLNVLSAIGLIVLIGLLDNDSVLKIDTMNRNINSMSLMDAIRLSGQRRLKSQIMTFLTTVLGLLPVLFSGGLGSELQQPLALSVIGGMCIGVIISWTLIPVLYWQVSKNR